MADCFEDAVTAAVDASDLAASGRAVLELANPWPDDHDSD